jgi:hypothetical protein
MKLAGIVKKGNIEGGRVERSAKRDQLSQIQRIEPAPMLLRRGNDR